MDEQQLYGDDCPVEIQDFINQNTDLDVYERIDRGVNGIVFYAKRKKLNDHVVLKFYIGNDSFDSSEEAVILQQINHENILRIHDLRFVEPYHAFFMSPKINGGDLQGLLDGSGIISSGDALTFTRGILLGLTELHSKHELVHRDLKPSNILFHKKNKIPIIADLGSVKKLDHEVGSTTTSKATRLYLPPESIIDNEYDYRSDIYQVGIILYQLLSGFFPLETPVEFLTSREKTRLQKETNSILWGNKLYELIDEKIYNGKILNLNTLPNHLDQGFKKLVKKATHADRNKRFQTPYEFLIALDKIIRTCPCYSDHNDHLLIQHGSKKEYRIYQNEKDQLVVEKRINGKPWRKDNSHDGNIETALKISRVA